MRQWFAVALSLLLLGTGSGVVAAEGPRPWVIETTDQWRGAISEAARMTIADGQAMPQAASAQFTSVVKTFAQRRNPSELTIEQSGSWLNWRCVANVGPSDAHNAPVLLPVDSGRYWFFAETSDRQGYHAWVSKDMDAWRHFGPIVDSRWVTTAEYADGRFFIYYDEPNDQDPHLVTYRDLTQPASRTKHGMVFADPSHGSDTGVLRDRDGVFHLIYEDWSPINARQRSWDSPLAGHATSADGIHGFEPHETKPPIDERSTPLPEFGTFEHPFDGKMRYHKHQGPQDAFGDYSLIRVGDRYYAFCDYDPHDGPMRVGVWSSESMDAPFTWRGSIGEGFHPDPTIGFAEGRFYLIVQRTEHDYVSRGPWVGPVQVRGGVDVDGDGEIDQWTDWQTIRETYRRESGFARVVEKRPARVDLTALPAGTGFQFQLRTEAQAGTEDRRRAKFDRAILSFE
jgi:hypothetical protein